MVATRCGGGGGAPSGGKGGRDGPLGRLVAEAGGDIDLQAGLVVLDEEDIVPALLDHRLADLPLAEQGIAGDDPAADRQDPQQLQGRLMLISLGIDADLGQDRLHQRGIGGD